MTLLTYSCSLCGGPLKDPYKPQLCEKCEAKFPRVYPKEASVSKFADVCASCNLTFDSFSDWQAHRRDVHSREADSVDHPPHYTSHPSGVECIQITEHMNFNLGNATKYVWRASLKGNQLEDLKKARWYLDREIQRLEKSK